MDDARTSIALAFRELAPWRARFDFLVYQIIDDDTGELCGYEYENAGFALEREITLAEANARPDDSKLAEKIEKDFLASLVWYRRMAELHMRFQNDEAARVRSALLRLDHERLLDLIAEAVRRLGSRRGSRSELCAEFNYERTQMWRLLKECEATGRLPAGTLPRR